MTIQEMMNIANSEASKKINTIKEQYPNCESIVASSSSSQDYFTIRQFDTNGQVEWFSKSPDNLIVTNGGISPGAYVIRNGVYKQLAVGDRVYNNEQVHVTNTILTTVDAAGASSGTVVFSINTVSVQKNSTGDYGVMGSFRSSTVSLSNNPNVHYGDSIWYVQC